MLAVTCRSTLRPFSGEKKRNLGGFRIQTFIILVQALNINYLYTRLPKVSITGDQAECRGSSRGVFLSERSSCQTTLWTFCSFYSTVLQTLLEEFLCFLSESSMGFFSVGQDFLLEKPEGFLSESFMESADLYSNSYIYCLVMQLRD